MAECGYTLPVWVAAAALAAVRELRGQPFESKVQLLLEPAAGRSSTAIPVQAAARLSPERALATSCCDPGEVLDLTRGLQVWVEASWTEPDAQGDWLHVLPGTGVGVHAASGEACLSAYARQLLETNLLSLLPDGRGLRLTITLPEGRRRAERTSNAAFGVVDGLALIGTQALVQRSAAPDQLAQAREELERRSRDPLWRGDLVLVLGENGLDLAPQQGLPPALLLKAGNWIGPLLVAAAELGVKRLLLFGYQGKLIKLAGGIFHTHHHLADGRLEILAAQAVHHGCSLKQIRLLLEAASVDQALSALAADDAGLAAGLQQRLADVIEQRSRAYLAKHHHDPALQLGAVLFDRSRSICARGPVGAELLEGFRA